MLLYNLYIWKCVTIHIIIILLEKMVIGLEKVINFLTSLICCFLELAMYVYTWCGATLDLGPCPYKVLVY